MFLIVLLAVGPEDIGVIDMALLSVIRRWHFREGMPIREIERRTGLSRNTIHKYLRSGAVEPKFKVPARPSKLDPFAEKLTGWLRIGSGRYPAPPRDDEDQSAGTWATRLEQARAEAQTLDKALLKQGEGDRTHSEIQAWLRDIGHALGYDVWIAANDRGRLHEGVPLGTGCLASLRPSITTSTGGDAIRLIDVLWLEPKGDSVAAAFEVEHSTSIYSGIVRMLDLALSGSDLHTTAGLFLVAPDARESEVRAQLARPAFSRVADLEIAYLPYGELERHKDAISRFGSGLKAIKAIARALP